MNLDRATIAPVIGAVLAVLCQIVLAPNLVVFSAVPNFLVVYVIVLSMIRPMDTTYIYAFVLGLISDLLGTSPIGLMTILLLAATFAAPRVIQTFGGASAGSPVVIFAAIVVLLEFLYGILMMICGFASSPIDTFLYRALPGAVYDFLLGLIIYWLCTKLLVPGASAAEPTFR